MPLPNDYGCYNIGHLPSLKIYYFLKATAVGTFHWYIPVSQKEVQYNFQ